jgi:peptide chain release factor 3
VQASFERATIDSARWVTCDDDAVLKEFVRAQQSRLARDVDGNLVYLADSGVNLRLTIERWPRVRFHATREHGQRIAA